MHQNEAVLKRVAHVQFGIKLFQRKMSRLIGHVMSRCDRVRIYSDPQSVEVRAPYERWIISFHALQPHTKTSETLARYALAV